ncbi:LPS O-antigen chain length determinant protein WzzB [Rodentibacter sp. Ppn85]|uniref:LPS O-antigen chain length determinant protein WzzB n=1 Tax=Rodentibacter sp. Ppn85 TaxID=1908525 RepID=UPI0009863FA0|nr:LPS O-antigen chain length determinant protein WzzB [Rodentibacter sp. Ppn85]OOF64402.1 chain-length determining protein [Rodentibacter sp. Ppn85]
MNSTKATNNDEIDLIELIKVLWNKKIWILFSAFVCTLIAGVYAFTAKEQWTSTAIVVAPRSTDLGSLLPVRAEYARIIDDGEFSAGKLSGSLYGQFKHFLLSNDLKRQFLEQSEWVKNYTKDMTDEQKHTYIENTVAQYLIVHEVDTKKKDLTELDKIGLKITFSAETPKDAQAVLNDYIDFMNQYTIELTVKEFDLGFRLRLDNLNFTKTQIESSLKEVKTVQLENLTNALDIAKKAGITEFSKGNTNSFSVPEYMLGEGRLNISDSKLADGTYLFMLGEKYLQAQLDIVKNTPIVYSTNYYSTDRQLSQLNALASKLADKFDAKAYHYLNSPDYPVVKDKPKKALIIVIGFIIGLILSTFIILFGFIFQNSGRE